MRTKSWISSSQEAPVRSVTEMVEDNPGLKERYSQGEVWHGDNQTHSDSRRSQPRRCCPEIVSRTSTSTSLTSSPPESRTGRAEGEIYCSGRRMMIQVSGDFKPSPPGPENEMKINVKYSPFVDCLHSDFIFVIYL